MNLFKALTPKMMTFYLDTKTTIRQALEKFDVHKFSVVPIIDEEGNYVTTVSEGDILRFIKNECDFNIRKAEDTLVMDIEHYRSYRALSQDGEDNEIIDLIMSQNFIPIVDDRGKYIGIIKRKEILRYLKDRALSDVNEWDELK